MPKLLPLKDELINAMKVAESSIEAAEYLGFRFKQILIENKMLEQCKDMLAKVQEYVEYVKFKLTSTAQPWSGEVATANDFQTMQANIATNTSKSLERIVGEINNLKLDFAIDDSTALLRGYSADGNALAPETVDALDKLFNAWLAEHNLATRDSTIYEVNAKGEINKDAKGNPIKANAERVKALITDRQQGLINYLTQKGINITVQQHPYPNAQADAQQQHAVKAAAQEIQEQVAPAESIEPESPQSGISST